MLDVKVGDIVTWKVVQVRDVREQRVVARVVEVCKHSYVVHTSSDIIVDRDTDCIWQMPRALTDDGYYVVRKATEEEMKSFTDMTIYVVLDAEAYP